MSLVEKIHEAKELLIEVVEKRGAYSLDPLEHAKNVMENASERAKKATEILDEVLAVVGDSLAELEKLTKKFPFDFSEWDLESCTDDIPKLKEWKEKFEAKVEELTKQ